MDVSSNKIQCPLVGEIAKGTCFDIHCYVDNLAPKWIVPESVSNNPNSKEICYMCKYHRND